MVDTSKEWNYSESYLWGNGYPACNGVNQSPIDIDTEDMKECRTLCNILPRIKPSKCYLAFKNNTISIKYDGGSYTEYEGTLYELKEVSIHTPSLHTIDGQRFDLEVCLLHKLTDNSSDTAGLTISCMFEAGPHFGKPESFISQIIYNIPTEPINYDKEIKVSNDWSAAWLIPEESGHFSYNGSIPYPPCTQVYKTFVYEKIGKIGVTNIETFKRYLGNNARPVRSLENRTIFYTPFLKSKFSEKKVFRSSNKYLKCYKENRPIKPIVGEEVKQTGSVSSTGINARVISKIYAFGLSLVILLLFINAFYFTKWLFRHFYVQKAMRFISGREKIGYDTIKLWKGCQGKIVTARDKQLLQEGKDKAKNVHF